MTQASTNSTFRPDALMNHQGITRPALQVMYLPADPEVAPAVWVSDENNGTLKYTVDGTIKRVLNDAEAVVSDSFDRANSSTLGTADSGQLWVNRAGGLGIVSGKATRNAGSVVEADIDAGLSDCVVSVDLTWQLNAGIAFRVFDSTNYFMARIASPAGLQVYSIAAGAATVLGAYAFTPVAGTTYRLSVRLEGTSIIASIDGVERVNISSNFNRTYTKHGLTVRDVAATDTFDNFEIAQLSGG